MVSFAGVSAVSSTAMRTAAGVIFTPRSRKIMTMMASTAKNMSEGQIMVSASLLKNGKTLNSRPAKGG